MRCEMYKDQIKRYKDLREVGCYRYSKFHTMDVIKESTVRIATDLAECDDSICNALLDVKSEEYLGEYEKIEEYREKLDVARIRVKAYFEKLSPISESQVEHVSRRCKSTVKCMICQKKHWTILCHEKANNTSDDTGIEGNVVLANQSEPEIILQALLVLIEADGRRNIYHLSAGLIAVDTYLGWSVMGRPKADSNNYSSISLFVQSHFRPVETRNYWYNEPILFLLSAVIHRHFDQYLSTPYHDAAVKLKNSFYVDNCVTSVNSEKELRCFIEDSTNLMAQARFDLRSWEFTGEAISLRDPKPTPVLGLLWDKSEDVLFKSVKGLKTLNVLKDEESILGIKTKLTENNDLQNFSYPILLPGKHRVYTRHSDNQSAGFVDKLYTTDVKRRLKYQQSFIQHLRSRFRHEYLGILCNHERKALTMRYMDNTVRVVIVKTQCGEIVLPVRQIYPLEIKCTDDESHSSGKPLTTKSGRTVKVPSRFLRT
ncbi:integrase_H2C2 domain-containing protein [Trichonephila clavata]|uniref:Integrase_H2C2 domain-containing protein n=1 Tax=Trichonephila clavata TaxID=2740835 RepID=A0A8X6M1I4_TRICU|nr:integrase_H2C2 domain-containing protein [Trichonephila clavata]